MKESIGITRVGQVNGINEEGSYYSVKTAPNGDLWFIGGPQNNIIYRFNGTTAQKWELNEDFGLHDHHTIVTFSDNATFFNLSRFRSSVPVVIKISENAAERWSAGQLDGKYIKSMVHTTLGLVCLLVNSFGDGNDIRIWASEELTSLLDLSGHIKNARSVHTTSDGNLLILDVDDKALVYDLENKEIVSKFPIGSYAYNFIACGAYNINYGSTKIEVRDPRGNIIHDIETSTPYGKVAGPLTEVISNLDLKRLVEIENITCINDEQILLHFANRDGSPKSHLRSLHIPTLSLAKHPLDGCIKTSQYIIGCSLDKSGALWLNRYINKTGLNELIVVREGLKKPRIQVDPKQIFEVADGV